MIYGRRQKIEKMYTWAQNSVAWHGQVSKVLEY
jgi:hypothetical protein